jgi:hypothetical protein
MNKNRRVCAADFATTVLVNDRHNRLQPAAVPTLVNTLHPPKHVTCAQLAPKRTKSDTMGMSTQLKVQPTIVNDAGMVIMC